MQTNPIIQASRVSFAYYDEETEQKAAPVLQDLSLEIQRGEMIALLGHNGCGKSTIAKHFNAILTPDSGDVVVDGINTKDESRLYDIRQRVGMVFQNPDNQIVATIVEEDVAFALENIGVEPQEIRRRVDEALKAVGMYEFREHSPHQLSGGQKQRVAIAGIIAMRPDVIVLDEPTAMLDPRGRREVIATVRRLNREYGITVVLITHYMDEAVQCDRVVVMEDGKILLDGLPKSVFSHVAVLKEVGLDVPQVTDLFDGLARGGVKLPGDVIGEEECVQQLATLLESAGIHPVK
ncbi:MAG: energy-coupling factor transporter ATPase [Oscillospiraceae bacterium]|jgi:energy-coupling factor transport system ATP-binding protein|nr:energy-coupling factor transporter ATPase [Oscillospiraceae bacterium]